MRRVPILMPQLGESIAEATLVQSHIKEGDEVTADQEILEVETNKSLLQVSAPAAGKVTELIAKPQQTYPVGAILGYLEVDDADLVSHAELPETEPSILQDQKLAEPALVTAMETSGAKAGFSNPTSGWAAKSEFGFLSPRVKSQLAEMGLQEVDLSAIPGTGAGGRITARDVETFAGGLESTSASLQPASAMRIAVADAMKRSWSRPLATVGRTVNLESALAHRKQCKAPQPGLTLYILRALALALRDDLKLAAKLVGNRVATPKSIHLGFAVEAENGIMTPVLHDVDQTSLLELTPKYLELIKLAQARRLSAEATVGGIATVSNYGPFGLLWGTPIPLPEQGFIIGLGAGQRLPHWDEAAQKFVPQLQAELSVTFDHRSMDGAGGGKLLAKMAALLEKPEAL